MALLNRLRVPRDQLLDRKTPSGSHLTILSASGKKDLKGGKNLMPALTMLGYLRALEGNVGKNHVPKLRAEASLLSLVYSYVLIPIGHYLTCLERGRMCIRL